MKSTIDLQVTFIRPESNTNQRLGSLILKMNNERNGGRSWSDIIWESVDIVDFVQRYEELTHVKNDVWRGSHANAHESSTGNCLVVDGNRNIWHCFSCGKAGNAITYEMERTRAEYVAACKNIAEVFNLNLLDPDYEQLSKEERVARDNRRNTDQRIAELLNAAADFYHRSLTPEARAYYHSRGITDKTIDELKLGYADENKRSLFAYLSGLDSHPTREELMATGLLYEKADVLYDSFYSRYILPYWRNGAQVCYFNARDSTDSDKRPKYKKQNCTADYVNKRVVEQVVWGAYEVPRKPKRIRINEDEDRDETALAPMEPEMPRIRIMICEGIIDAILARQEFANEFSVISPTTNRITNSDISNIAGTLEQIGKCYVVFCNDSDANSAGANGALDTSKKLDHELKVRHARTADALLASAESNNDLAWILEMGKDDYVASRMPMIKIATLPKPPEMDSIDVADYVELGIAHEILYWCHEHTARSLWQYEAYLEGNPNRFFEGGKESKYMPKLVSDEIRSESGRYFLSLGGRLFNYKNGVYLRDPNEERCKHLIADKLSLKRQPSHINNSVEDLIMSTYQPTDILAHRETEELRVNCKNGIYDVNQDTLTPHSPLNISLSQINANWEAGALCTKIDEFLGEILDEESQMVFWEMLGYCLVPDTRYHQSFIFIGSGANGKSTALDVVKVFLGEDNVSAVSLHAIEEKPYSAALLYGKMANVCADIPSTHLIKTDQFKNISAGDAVMIEEKFKTAFPAVLNCKLLFSANSMPTTSDRTNAFIRRWVPMIFSKTIAPEDMIPGFVHQLTTQDELDGAFVKAVEGLRRAVERGKIFVPGESQKFLSEYQAENDAVIEFDRNCVSESTESIANADLFEAFKQYCESSNRQAIGKIKFLKRFRELHPGKEIARVQGTGNKKGFQGITVSLEDIETDEFGVLPGNANDTTPGF